MSGFLPDLYLTHITKIDVEKDLLAKGITGVLLDVDNTILPRDTHQVPEEIKQWLASTQEKGVRICLLSNNFHHGVYEWAQRLGLPVVAKAVKPLPHGFIFARRKMKFKRKSTVMIGDQLITDVWGAHFCGMRCIMVLPLVKTDLWHTLLLRNLEKVFMGKRKPLR